MSSVLGDVEASYVLPRNVSVLLQRATSTAGPGGQSAVQAGFSAERNVAWVLAFGQLVLWRYSDGVDARIISIYLPSQLLSSHGSAELHVSVLAPASQHAAGTNVTAVVCSPSGLLVAWPNVELSSEPVIHQLPAPSTFESGGRSLHVTACTLVSPPASSGMLFLGAVSLDDGSVQLVQGNQQGMHSRVLAGKAPAVSASAPRGMLNVLGQALASAYTEAFDPAAKFLKRSPSGLPAHQLLARMPDSHRMHLYLLTDTTLDCWQVSMGMRVSEQLLWSAQTVTAASSVSRGGGVTRASNRRLALADDGAAFLLLGDDSSGVTRTWVHRMVLQGEAAPVHVDCTPLPPSSHDGTVPRVARLHASCDGGAVLLEGPEHVLYEWALGDPSQHAGVVPPPPATCTLVSDDSDTLAVTGIATLAAGAGTPAAEGPTWLLLNGTYGVLALHGGGGGHVSSPASPRAAHPRATPEPQSVGEVSAGSLSPSSAVMDSGAPLTLEQQQRVVQVLDSALGQAVAVVAAQQPLLTLSMGLRRQLQGLGVLSTVTSAEALSAYSAGLVDALPKQWGASGLPAPGADGSHGLTGSLLAAKQSKHALLLQCLLQAGLLHALPPHVVRALLEHGEQLSAAAAILPLHTHLLASQDPSAAPNLVVQVITAAGMSTEEADVAGDALQPSELFYCRPTRSLPALLPALGNAARAVQEQAQSGLSRPGDASAQQLAQHACGLAQLVGVVVAAVGGRQEEARTAYRIPPSQLYRQLGQPSWLADGEARDALDELTQACEAVGALVAPAGTSGPVPPTAAQLSRMMFGCTEVLLSGFAAAVECASEGEALSAVQQQYASVRERCLSSLLNDGRRELDPSTSLPADCLLLQVQQLAAAHACFPALFDACELVDTWPGGTPAHASLHHYMARVKAERGVPATHTFARYCYQRLVDEGRPADLFQLPASFYPDLHVFLAQQPAHAALLWPLLLRMEEWGAATSALMSDAEASQASYVAQRRLVSLAYLAAKRAGDDSAAASATARIQLLGAQDALVQLQTAELMGLPLPGVAGEQALPASTLVGAALAAEVEGAKGKGAFIALQALATMSPSARHANRQSEQAAWRYLVSATDWTALQWEHTDAGASDALVDALRDTPLYQAAVLCCRNGLLGSASSGVADTGPAQEVQAWVRSWAQDDAARSRYAVQALELGLHEGAGVA